jgi:hypothetical protein
MYKAHIRRDRERLWALIKRMLPPRRVVVSGAGDQKSGLFPSRRDVVKVAQGGALRNPFNAGSPSVYADIDRG